jgi:hypothetical protein
MPKFDYAGAKKAGYTDEQINENLSSKYGFDSKAAQEAGYTLEDINKNLSSYEQKKVDKPVDVKRAAQSYGIGVAGGVGGVIPDIAQLTPLTYALSKLGIKTTPEQVKALREDFGVEEPQNAMERILEKSGEFGGQEGLIGTAIGGPAAGAAGLAHGSASGMFYGSLKEAGVPDNWALGATMLMTVSPIAAQKLISKYKQGKSLSESIKSIEKDLPAPPPPPGSPPTKPPVSPILKYEGREVPAGTSSQELAEEALEHLTTPKTQEAVEQIALTPKEKSLSTEIGEQIAPETFYNEKHGGRFFEGNLKKIYKQEKAKVNNLYKRAEKSYAGVNDIMPNVAKLTENGISKLRLSGSPTSAERQVIEKLEDIQKLIGESDGLREVSLSRMIKTADSLSDIVKYEVEGAGVKNILKEYVGAINSEIKGVLTRRGLSTKAIEEADKAYGNMANVFFSDEIEPFLKKTVRNPEELFKKASNDPATYRAIREALEKVNPKGVNRLERSIVESRSRPYVGRNNLEKIGSEEFYRDMANLEGVIGKKANKVKSSLENHKLRHESSAAYIDKTPSQIRKMFDAPEGIRELRKKLPEELFEKMAEDKTLQIFRGGVVSPEKITGKQLFDNLRKEHNYDILKEIYGKEAIDKALVDASKANKTRMTIEKFIQLGKIAGTIAGAGKLIKVVGILL